MVKAVFVPVTIGMVRDFMVVPLLLETRAPGVKTAGRPDTVKLMGRQPAPIPALRYSQGSRAAMLRAATRPVARDSPTLPPPL